MDKLRPTTEDDMTELQARMADNKSFLDILIEDDMDATLVPDHTTAAEANTLTPVPDVTAAAETTTWLAPKRKPAIRYSVSHYMDKLRPTTEDDMAELQARMADNKSFLDILIEGDMDAFTFTKTLRAIHCSDPRTFDLT